MSKYMSKITITCRGCGGEFEVYPYRADTAKYCTKKCQRKEKVTNNCENCGGEYEVYPYRSDDARFCSYECKGEWMKFAYSGEKHPRWTGGNNGYRGANWPIRREEVRERDGYKCFFCGLSQNENNAIYDEDLSVHHVTPYRVDKDNSDGNLITMCKVCHHRMEDTVVENGT